MSLTRRVFAGTALLLGARGLGLFLVLAARVEMTNALPKEEFGQLAFVLTIFMVLTALTNLGLNTILVRELARAPERRASIMAAGITLKLAGVLPAVAIGAAYYGWRGAPGGWPLFFLAAPTLLFSFSQISLRSALELPFQAELRVGAIAFTRLAYQGLMLGLVLYLALARASVLAFCGALVAAELGGAVFLLVLYWGRYGAPRLTNDTGQLGYLLGQSWPLLLTAFGLLAMARVDILFLEIFRGPAAVAEYQAALSLVDPLNVIPTVFLTLMLPVLSGFFGRDPERYARAQLGLFRYLSLAAVPLAFFISFRAADIILLYKAEYAAAAACLQPLVWTAVLFFLVSANHQVLVAEHRQRFTALLIGVAALAAVLANWLLVPAHGTVGAAFARLAAFGSIFAFQALFAGTRGLTARVLSSLWRPLLAGYAASWLLLLPWGHWLVWLPVYGGAYLVLLKLGGEDLELRRLTRSTP